MTGTIDAAATGPHMDARREGLAAEHRWPAGRARARALLLAVHIAAAVGVLGADLALMALGLAGAFGSDPVTIYPAAHRIGEWVAAPLAVAALGTGVLLGASTRWGLVTHWWVAIKLAITTVLTAALLFVLVPALGDAAALAAMPSPHELTDAARRRLAIAPIAASALLATNVLLAVLKPGGRLRPASPSAGSPASGAGATPPSRTPHHQNRRTP